METLIYWVLITLAAIFVGMGKGGLPVIATLGVPSLSLIMSPITAAGLLLPVYIVSDIFALSAYRRDYNWPVLRIGLIGMTIGVIIGGRLGYVFFYQPKLFFSNPFYLFEIWKGGMSFHGGLIGMILSIYLFSKKNNVNFFYLSD